MDVELLYLMWHLALLKESATLDELDEIFYE
jgi:hypothetical protein